MEKIFVTASNTLIAETTSNNRYMTLTMRMFSTQENLNHVAVTEAFIDDIVANKDEYICMPLCADVPKLKSKDYKGLTHLYDREKGVFYADRIGSFYDFEKVEDEYGVSLIGYARVDKRCQAVCDAIEELYAQGNLNFSFEITAGDIRVEKGVTIVDASKNNELTAMAIVSVPAYPESKALDLVAEAPEQYEALYANAKFVTAEVDIGTVKAWFYEALQVLLGEHAWHMRVMLFCPDSVILYDECCGKIMKAEWMLEGEDFILKDFYEVGLDRKDDDNFTAEAESADIASSVVTNENETPSEEIAEVSEEEVLAESGESVEQIAESAEVSVEEVTAENESGTQTAETDDNDEGSPEEENENNDDPEDGAEEQEMAEATELENMKARCAELEQKVAELEPFRAEIERIRAEEAANELAAKKEELKNYAIAEGLNTDNEVVAQAIEDMDYSALVKEVMAHKSNNRKKSDDKVSYATYYKMDVGGFGYLYERSKNK